MILITKRAIPDRKYEIDEVVDYWYQNKQCFGKVKNHLGNIILIEIA